MIVRGKAGAEVEFGNKLFLSKTSQGLIGTMAWHARNLCRWGELIESMAQIPKVEAVARAA